MAPAECKTDAQSATLLDRGLLDRALLLDLETGADGAVHKIGALRGGREFRREGRFNLALALEVTGEPQVFLDSPARLVHLSVELGQSHTRRRMVRIDDQGTLDCFDRPGPVPSTLLDPSHRIEGIGGRVALAQTFMDFSNPR